MNPTTPNPMPDQNKQPDAKPGVPLTEAEKKAAADKAAQSGSKS